MTHVLVLANIQLVERIKEAEGPYVETATALYRIKLMRYEEETSEIEAKMKGAKAKQREKVMSISKKKIPPSLVLA